MWCQSAYYIVVPVVIASSRTSDYPGERIRARPEDLPCWLTGNNRFQCGRTLIHSYTFDFTKPTPQVDPDHVIEPRSEVKRGAKFTGSILLYQRHELHRNEWKSLAYCHPGRTGAVRADNLCEVLHAFPANTVCSGCSAGRWWPQSVWLWLVQKDSTEK